MTAEAMVDVPRSPEQLTLHPVDAAINLAVNNPAKMLTLLVLAERPGYAFTGTEIKDRLNEAQGTDAGWRVEEGEGFKRYCQFSLVPAGLAVETTVTTSRGIIPAFEVSERGLEWGVPLFGPLLDLELRSDFSSQRTFGPINSIPSGAPDEMRSSLIRMRVLEEFCAAQDRPVNLASLCRIIPRPKGTINKAITELATAGVLHVLHKSNPADRILELSRPDPARAALHRSRMRPEIAATHDAIATLYRRGVRELDGSALLDEVESRIQDVDRVKLWQALADTTPYCMRFIDEARFGTNKGKDAPRTRIEVTRESEAVVEELVRSVAAVRDSAEYRTLAAHQARQIMARPGAVSYLMSKAQSNSPKAKYDADESLRTMDRLAGKLLGWVSLRRLILFQNRPELLEGDWRNSAACLDEDPELFFGLGESMTPAEAEKARSVCGDCIAKLHCLRWAVEQPELYGVWGGTTEKERRELPKATLALLQALGVRPLVQLTKASGNHV